MTQPFPARRNNLLILTMFSKLLISINFVDQVTKNIPDFCKTCKTLSMVTSKVLLIMRVVKHLFFFY